MDYLSLKSDLLHVLVFLIPGFIGFRIYLIDKPWNVLSPVNIFYGSLVFSLVSYLLYGALTFILEKEGIDGLADGKYSYALMATPFAIATALLWKKWGHRIFHDALIKMKITNEDNNSEPWMQIFGNPSVGLTQIWVHTKDGCVYWCDETSFFDKKELKSKGIYTYYTSSGGGICFVANKYKEQGDNEWRDIEDIEIEDWGIKIQWIPKEEIARVEARAI